MTTWTFNSDGTVTFATGYGDITVIDEFLDNGYFGDNLADISTSHPNYAAAGRPYRGELCLEDVVLWSGKDSS